jgi:hypothetical protein
MNDNFMGLDGRRACLRLRIRQPLRSRAGPVQQRLELTAGPREAGADRADRDLEHPGGLLIGHALDGDQDDHLLEHLGEFREAPLQVADLQRVILPRGAWQTIDTVLERHPLAMLRLARIRAHHVQEDGKEPAAQVDVLAVEVEAGDGAFQAILHHIAGEVGIVNEAPGIAPQARDVRLDLAQDVRGHRCLRGENRRCYP